MRPYNNDDFEINTSGYPMTNKKNRRSIRLSGYDYSQPGMYFVTICVREKECLLGEIIEGKIRLFDFGEIASAGWTRLSEDYPTLSVDPFCIMPNHVHAIIQIHETIKTKTGKPKSLGQLVGAYKAFTTKQINHQRSVEGILFWQRNYYEHIVRNQKDLNRIQEYILNNPSKWELDDENPVNQSPQ